jgi:hypothetical protein
MLLILATENRKGNQPVLEHRIEMESWPPRLLKVLLNLKICYPEFLMPVTKWYQKAGLVKRCLKAYAAWKNHSKVLLGIGS